MLCFALHCFSSAPVDDEGCTISFLNLVTINLVFIIVSDSYDKLSMNKNKLEVSVAPNTDESSGISISSDSLAEYSDKYLSTPCFTNLVGPSYTTSSNQYNPCGIGFISLPDYVNEMKEKVEHLTQGTSSNGMMSKHVGKLDDTVREVPMPGDKGLGAPSGGVSYASPGNGVSASRFSNKFCIKQENGVKDAKLNRLIASQVITSQHVNDITRTKSSAEAVGLSPGKGSNPSCSGYWTSENHEIFPKEERDRIRESKRPRLGLDEHDGTASGMPSSVGHDQHFDLLNLEPSHVLVSSTVKQQFLHAKVIKESGPSLPHINGSHLSNISGQEVYSDSLVQTYHTDDDDVCILEDVSGPARPFVSVINGKLLVAPKSTVICNSFNSVGGPRPLKLKANGERSVFRVALEVSSGWSN